MPPLRDHSKLKGFRKGSLKLLFIFELLVTIQILNFYEEGSLTRSRRLTSFLSRHLGYPERHGLVDLPLRPLCVQW